MSFTVDVGAVNCNVQVKTYDSPVPVSRVLEDCGWTSMAEGKDLELTQAGFSGTVQRDYMIDKTSYLFIYKGNGGNLLRFIRNTADFARRFFSALR